MVLEMSVTEEVLQDLQDKRDLENSTPGVPKIDMTLHDWEEAPVA